tara:strand:- start:1565 stop:2794 length:1230 start_codon:yes stop_codon:yes gene_type:complete
MNAKHKQTNCKVTGKKIPIVFNFGKMPIANEFSKIVSQKNFYEMKIAFNENNGVFQLVDAPKPKKLFNKNYAFLSSTSYFMKDHFKKIANKIKKRMKSKFSIMEIGCNDGIFLQNFRSYNHLGVEPSKNVFNISKSKKLNVVNSFFNMNLIKKKKLENKFDIIYAANVICHIPDINSLFKCIEISLKENGTFIFEEPYLGAMIEKTSYDQIYDEHFYMFSANSIKSIVKNFNLQLMNSERISTHGGSMRYYLKKTNSKKISENLKKIFEYENTIKITELATIKNFFKKCKNSKKRIIQIIKSISNKKIPIYGYGATSKSTTIIHFCNINFKMIRGIFDNSPTKINKFLPGKKIKIINYNEFKKIKPKYCFLFAWNHYKEIFKKESKNNIKWLCHIDKKHFPKKFRRNFI